jgi:hypothetical protein
MPGRLRARVAAAIAARVSPEWTRRATPFERLTVQRLSWDSVVRLNRYLELTGKLATGIWVAFACSLVFGVEWGGLRAPQRRARHRPRAALDKVYVGTGHRVI